MCERVRVCTNTQLCMRAGVTVHTSFSSSVCLIVCACAVHVRVRVGGPMCVFV